MAKRTRGVRGTGRLVAFRFGSLRFFGLTTCRVSPSRTTAERSGAWQGEFRPRQTALLVATSVTCPACGFEPLDVPPYRDYTGVVPEEATPPYDEYLGQASYDVCPRCGFEFGNDDNPGTAPASTFREYRQEWLDGGSRWFDRPRGLASAEGRLGLHLPDSVRQLYIASDGVFHEPGQWWVVWPLERLVTANQHMWEDRTLPTDLLAFGDDGAGAPFCVRVDPETDEVLRWSPIDLDIERSEGSMTTFAREWLARDVS